MCCKTHSFIQFQFVVIRIRSIPVQFKFYFLISEDLIHSLFRPLKILGNDYIMIKCNTAYYLNAIG